VSYVATIGFFDGVHTGHCFVLSSLKGIAQRTGLDAAVITFSEHPKKVLTGVAQPLLTVYDERVELLKQQNLDQIFAFNFEVIRAFTAEEFMRILHNQCDVEMLLLGYDHHFGSDRLTQFADYQAAADRVGLQLVQLPQNPESAASSTKIRKALLAADIEAANTLLGYSYSLTGEVVAGRQIGRTIGFPTANLQVAEDKLLPAAGVYEVAVVLPDGEHRALLNIGTNPTVNSSDTIQDSQDAQPATSIELHIPSYEADLYGQRLTVRLLRYLRPERRFSSLDELREQISHDLASIQ